MIIKSLKVIFFQSVLALDIEQAVKKEEGWIRWVRAQQEVDVY